LREAIPTASRVGFLGSRQIWELPQVNTMREAFRALNISLLGPPLESPIQEGEYRRVIGVMAQEHADGVIVGDQLEMSPTGGLLLTLPTKRVSRQFSHIVSISRLGGSSLMGHPSRMSIVASQVTSTRF
jgi:hypothetical protein